MRNLSAEPKEIGCLNQMENESFDESSDLAGIDMHFDDRMDNPLTKIQEVANNIIVQVPESKRNPIYCVISCMAKNIFIV